MIIMKKLSSLLIGCSLALAGAAWAQQPAEQQSPSKGKRAPEKTHAAEAKPGANAPQPQGGPTKQTGAIKERGATNERAATNRPGAEKGKKTGRESANPAETNVSGQPTGGTRNEPGAEKGRKGRPEQESAKAPATGMPTKVGKEQQVKEQVGKHPSTEAGAAPPASGGVRQNAQANAGVKAKKPEPQQVQQVKSEHANFHAQPKPQQVQQATVTP